MTRGRPFQKGNKLGGRQALPEDLRHLLKATGEQVKRDLCAVYMSDTKTLMALLQRKDVPAGLVMIASCMTTAIATGDNKIMATFLDRLIGKPVEPEESSESDLIDVNEKKSIARLQTLTDDELDALYASSDPDEPEEE